MQLEVATRSACARCLVVERFAFLIDTPANNSMQRTALRAAADAERYAFRVRSHR